MRIILTGATGFVGGEVLARLAARPEIEAITCLTRRPLSDPPAKANVVLLDDFVHYDPALVERLADHTACIWALGGKASDLGHPDALERVTHTFTLALAKAIAQQAKNRFTFCYLSGMGADPSETARLPWERLTRHLKGRTERDLGFLQQQHPGFCIHSFRPGGILPATAPAVLDVLLAPIVVRVGDLAEAMITAAVDPTLFGDAGLLHNRDIKRLARKRSPTGANL